MPIAATRPRLGWLSWSSEKSVIYCNRRLDDQGNEVGVRGPCSSVEVGGTPKRIMSWASVQSPDTSSADLAPSPCHLLLEEAQLVPSPEPARLFLVSRKERILLESWSPPPEVNGDRFFVEASLSPSKKWMAIERIVVGVGEGERTIEFAAVELRETPRCSP